MKADNYEVPDNLLYTKEHEWAQKSAGSVRIGVTDYAAKTLNDVVYVTFPSTGQEVDQFKSFGTVESIKAVSELYAPLTGKVTKVNPELNSHPELVNKSPYVEGWIIEMAPSKYEEEKKNLLDANQYASYLRSLTQNHP